MRLWSLDLSYLDAKGFGATWNEAIIGKNALTGKRNGYKNHSQLTRFKNTEDPIYAINYYLWTIYKQSIERKYHYNPKYIDFNILSDKSPDIPVTNDQVEYERYHLLNKLWIRDRDKYHKLCNESVTRCNNTFRIINGEIEEWEKVK